MYYLWRRDGGTWENPVIFGEAENMEIKDFRVLRPPEDEGAEPLIDSVGLPYSRGLTVTGLFWLLLPFIFLFWKKLKFSMLEFWVTLIIWGISSGAITAGFSKVGSSFGTILFFNYLTFHSHCLAFTCVIYQELYSTRIWRVVFYQVLPMILWVMIGGSKAVWW